MPTDVLMPQMGESIAEGTIVRWIKNVGDTVEQDEPLFEISTDKVDTEVQSPAAGILSEIRAKEGETVAVNTVVAVIGGAVGGGSAKAKGDAVGSDSVHAESRPTHAVEPQESKGGKREGEDRVSPVVRRLAKEHGVDLSKVRGTGAEGRVTKDDVLAYLDAEGRVAAAGSGSGVPLAADRGKTEPMSAMRKKIAEHMVLSRRTSAHVHSVFEVDFTRVADVMTARRAEFERAGQKLTFLPFIVKAAAATLQALPIVNASIVGENIVYHQDVNIGIAVALEWGLIVPVVKHADRQNLAGMTVAIADLAARARSKQLRPEEVAGGTFTITNPGGAGSLIGLPIINQPQVAILAVGSIAKRPVVVDDAIGIRLMGYMALGYDHRLIDGSIAEAFISRIKRELESWDPAAN